MLTGELAPDGLGDTDDAWIERLGSHAAVIVGRAPHCPTGRLLLFHGDHASVRRSCHAEPAALPHALSRAEVALDSEQSRTERFPQVRIRPIRSFSGVIVAVSAGPRRTPTPIVRQDSDETPKSEIWLVYAQLGLSMPQRLRGYLDAEKHESGQIQMSQQFIPRPHTDTDLPVERSFAYKEYPDRLRMETDL